MPADPDPTVWEMTCEMAHELVLAVSLGDTDAGLDLGLYLAAGAPERSDPWAQRAWDETVEALGTYLTETRHAQPVAVWALAQSADAAAMDALSSVLVRFAVDDDLAVHAIDGLAAIGPVPQDLLDVAQASGGQVALRAKKLTEIDRERHTAAAAARGGGGGRRRQSGDGRGVCAP